MASAFHNTTKPNQEGHSTSEGVNMEKALTLLLLLSAGQTGLGVKVYYVRPTRPSTECPGSPCYSLQYYANHSSFTSNSVFHFMVGEHDLSSMVNSEHVVNLSLVGGGSGVKITCNSFPSGFHISNFNGLTLENLTLLDCSGIEKSAVYLLNGSGLDARCITIRTSGYALTAMNVLGQSLIVNSTFVHTSKLYSVAVQLEYVNCSGQSHTLLRHSEFVSTYIGLAVTMHCENVSVLVMDCLFTNETGIYLDWIAMAESSVIKIHDSIFSEAGVYGVVNAVSNCELNCSYFFMEFVGVTMARVDTGESPVQITFTGPRKDYIIVFKDSTFSNIQSHKTYANSFSLRDAKNCTVQVTFDNVTFTNVGLFFLVDNLGSPISSLQQIAAIFIDCSFENNTESAIEVNPGCTLFFQGNNHFKNNSAQLGAGIQLHFSSYIYVRPNTYILFENNHAAVGGAIYIEYDDMTTPTESFLPCFFQVDSPSISKDILATIEINFINNTADYGGSSLYGGSNSCCDISYPANDSYRSCGSAIFDTIFRVSKY